MFVRRTSVAARRGLASIAIAASNRPGAQVAANQAAARAQLGGELPCHDAPQTATETVCRIGIRLAEFISNVKCMLVVTVVGIRGYTLVARLHAPPVDCDRQPAPRRPACRPSSRVRAAFVSGGTEPIGLWIDSSRRSGRHLAFGRASNCLRWSAPEVVKRSTTGGVRMLSGYTGQSKPCLGSGSLPRGARPVRPRAVLRLTQTGLCAERSTRSLPWLRARAGWPRIARWR
jgi:hypothetical protein